jgi:hypothetical protein
MHYYHSTQPSLQTSIVSLLFSLYNIISLYIIIVKNIISIITIIIITTLCSLICTLGVPHRVY